MNTKQTLTFIGQIILAFIATVAIFLIALNISGWLMKFTKYKIKRDHSIENGFFVVDVDEISQWGFGFQLFINGFVYGFSITNK